MKKKLLVGLTTGLFVAGMMGTSLAENEATFDFGTGTLNIPKVDVGSVYYNVDMQQQGQDLDFEVTLATPSTSSSTENIAIYNSSTGDLNIPTVIVGSDSYNVDMAQQGYGYNFSVTTACVEGASIAIFDYFKVNSGEIRVYSGTWDTEDIRIEVSGLAPSPEVIAGLVEDVYETANYNYNSDGYLVELIYTSYEYEKDGLWINWKEVDSDSSENIYDFHLFKANMAIGEILVNNGITSELLEESQGIFPELSSDALDYVKFKITFDTDFFIVYFVKGYGEYVLQANSTDLNMVNRYLIYSEYGSIITGTKPVWFDSVRPQLL
jgi:hypothetical protein